jgi:hypothetical protein
MSDKLKLYDISSVVILDKVSKNLFELTPLNPSRNFVPSEDLKQALKNSPLNVQAVFEKVLGPSDSYQKPTSSNT